MTDTSSPIRVEPTVDPSAAPPAPTIADSGAPADASAHQLSRIEEKTARIEEKYARSEALLLRMGDKVDAATARMSEVARQTDLAALREEVTALSQRVRGLPGVGTLFVLTVLAIVLTSAATVVALRYGIPGVLPR